MYQRILVPVDGSSTSNFGLEEAIQLAKLTHGRLRLTHVVDELSLAIFMDAYSGHAGDWQQELRTEGARILAKAKAIVRAAGVEVDSVLHDGFKDTVTELVIADAAKWPADLIVLGTHGRRGVERMVMGSSAEKILRHSLVPVLLVRMPMTKNTNALRMQ